jgi:hypothetical protein
VGAGDAERPAHGPGDLLRVVHELDVERVDAGVDDRVPVERLGGSLMRFPDVDGMVVHRRIGADEAADRPGDRRDLDEAAREGALLEGLADRRPVGDRRDARVEDRDGLLVELGRDDRVHAVEPVRDEPRDFDR